MSNDYLLIQLYSNTTFNGYVLIKIINTTYYIYIISVTNNIKTVLKKLKCKNVNFTKNLSKYLKNNKFWNSEEIEWDFLNCKIKLQEFVEEFSDKPVSSKP